MSKIGIALGTPDTTGPMGKTDKLIGALTDLSAPFVRTRCPMATGTNSFARIHVPIAKAGIKIHAVDVPGRSVRDHIDGILAIEKIVPGCIMGLEGPNEPDLNPVAPDARLGVRTGKGAGAMARTKALFTALREIRGPEQVKMVAFNDFMQAQQKPFTSFANSHIYPKGVTLKNHLSAFGKLVKAHGRGAGVISEWGYTNGLGSNFREISEEQAALNFAGDIRLINASKAIRWAFIYTLVDYPGANEFNRFGLCRSDWSRKPAFEAVRAALASR